MRLHSRSGARGPLLVLGAVLAASVFFSTRAAAHGDVPHSLVEIRHDANLTDLHVFVVEGASGRNLVLTLGTNRTIPAGATSYVFPTDVTFEIYLDVDAAVIPDNPDDPTADGGLILKPDKIREDIIFRMRFRDDGSVKLQRKVRGKAQIDPNLVNFFAGLRDDPFIRVPRTGRNVAAIVLELPLSSVLNGQSTLLAWATSKVEEFDGPFQDISGRALRSQFPEQNALNQLRPRDHLRRAGFTTSVVIYNTDFPAVFPNGRALEDDVVDLVCQLGDECRVFNMPGEGGGGPSANDVPFLSAFPYLAPPHPAP